MNIAMTAQENVWWIALGIGFVVILCVIILLVLLGSFVADIDRHVRSVGAGVRILLENTSATAAMGQTPARIGALAAELARHVDVLSEGGDPA